MFRSGLVDTLVTHANIKGFGLTPLSGDCRDYMPPLLKTKTTTLRQMKELIWTHCELVSNSVFCSPSQVTFFQFRPWYTSVDSTIHSSSPSFLSPWLPAALKSNVYVPVEFWAQLPNCKSVDTFFVIFFS